MNSERPSPPAELPVATGAASRRKQSRFPMNSTRWLALHGWVGMAFGLWLFLICFSGAFAVFSYEIDWLLDERRRSPGAKPGEVNWEAVKNELDSQFPYHRINYISGPRHDGFAVQAYANRADGFGSKIFIDPKNGKLLGESSFYDVQRFFRSLHRNLFNGRMGIFVVTCFAWVLLLATVSALFFLKRWWRGLFRLRRSARRPWLSLIREGHRLAGLWSLPLGALIAATGLWYQMELVAPFSEPRGRIEEAKMENRPPTVELANLNKLARRSESAIPGLTVNVLYHQGPHAPLGFAGHRQWWARERANAVQFDPVSGEQLHAHRAGELGVHGIISNAADPLHFGTFGGLPSQVLWFLGGLILSALPLTGSVMWYRRHLAGRERENLGRPGRMGLRAVPVATVALFIWIAFGALDEADYYFADGQSASVTATRELGPWKAELLRYESSGSTPQYGVKFSTAAHAHPLVADATWHVNGKQTTSAEPNGSLWWATLPESLAGKTLRFGAQTPRGEWHFTEVRGEELLAAGRSLPEVPMPRDYVWTVSALFSVLCLVVTGAWLRYLR